MLEKGGGFAIGIFPEGLVLSWECWTCQFPSYSNIYQNCVRAGADAIKLQLEDCFFFFFFRPHDYPKWNHMGSEMKSLRKTSQQSYIPRGKVSLLKIGGFSIYWCQAPKNLIRFNKEERKLKKC